ncbi:bacteriophage spanin2 family protein [Leisingera caerulea]|uniref:Bacteriophage spanin2 family protein n=1 Tax=Leisingera caerulea TaxID=506591 RepID=A0ABY5X067_LEICA|nr:bacteriophage spanin2 family protein [Leisingera caerulea]UWQ59975.1 bacteriophage spanin2 family protein [Leisingera caerulea]
MRFALVLAGVLALAGCDQGLGLLAKLAPDAGSDFAANIQAGKNNVQAIGPVRVSEQKIIRPQARRIEQRTVDGGAEIESVQTVEKVVGQEGWGAGAVFIALLFPSPLGLLWWPIGRRFAGRLRGEAAGV